MGSSSALADSTKSRRRIAVVVPYCGATTYGGAATLALAVTKQLATDHDVELLTTCATDYDTWRNAEPAGHERIGGVHVRRFAVDRERDRARFERLSRNLIYTPDAPIELQERWMRAQGPMSTALNDYLDAFGTRYDAVVFFSYLYATTYFGLPIVEDRAILAPLAHDEWPLAFSLWDRFFERPESFVFVSDEERALVQRRFPARGIDGPVAGIGITPPGDISADRFRSVTGISEPFLLYLGRIDQAKGCDELLADYARFRSRSAALPRLVLIGERHMEIRSERDVVVLGPVDERTKWDAIAACDVFVMPSPYESLSIAVLEAWSQGRPVLVNGRSETLVGQCRRAGGGLWYVNGDEFGVALEMLDPATRALLGARGRAFVQERYTWDRVKAVYLGVIDALAAKPA
jgi:glycosyltransferase involved in cell wall biosynthesis